MPALLRVCSIFGLVTAALSANEICFSAINRLAQYDKLFGEAPENPSNSRLNQKRTYAKSESTMDEFMDNMRLQRSLGTGFSCGYTADWVTEVFYGLSKQFVTKRLGDTGSELSPNLQAGYFPVAGQEVVDFFTRYAEFGDRVVFKIVHSPPIDHVIVVEQLPAQGGYRMYQSYNSAYGLNAWLAPRTANLSAMFDNGDIMSNPKWGPLFNSTIQALFGPTMNTENLQYVPDAASPLVPILKAFVTHFLGMNTKDSILTNFRKAKESYGEGNVVSKADFFGTYLPKLAAMSAFFKDNWGMGTPIPQTVADYWLDLYGTPNLMIFPGAPFNLVPNMIQSPATQYYLQASAVVVPEDVQCIMNRNLLAWSLLRPERRAATNLENVLDAPQASQMTGTLIGGIAIVAVLSMGVIFIAAKKVSHHYIRKPIVLDLEIASVDASSTPSASGSESPVVILESL